MKEFKRMYYLFILIGVSLLTFLINHYPSQMIGVGIVFVFVYVFVATSYNMKTFQWDDFGNKWYACREFNYKDEWDNNYSGDYGHMYSKTMINKREIEHPFSIFRFSLIMLVCFIINKILLWCGKYLSHKPKINEN